MSTMDVLDAGGEIQTIQKPLPPGRAEAALSRPVALSAEDKAVLDLLATRMQAVVTAVDGLEDASVASDLIATQTKNLLTTLNGYVDGVEGLLTALNGYVDGLEALAAAAIPAGANVIGKVGIDQTTPGTTNAVCLRPTFFTGKTSVAFNTAGGNNSTLIASGQKMVFNVWGSNTTAAWAFIKLYSKASSANESDTPLMVIGIPPGGVVVVPDIIGTAFPLGVAIRITTGPANADVTYPAANGVQAGFQLQ